jgi:hypothetical protein
LFDRVNHDLLMGRVAKHVADAGVSALQFPDGAAGAWLVASLPGPPAERWARAIGH